jgi:hypothetical protein
MRRRHLGSLVVLALAACTPTPTPVVPTPDASDASALGDTIVPTIDASADCVAACAALAPVCKLGSANDCASFMDRDIGSGKVANAATGKPLTCADVALVKSKTDAQKLGFVCP